MFMYTDIGKCILSADFEKCYVAFENCYSLPKLRGRRTTLLTDHQRRMVEYTVQPLGGRAQAFVHFLK